MNRLNAYSENVQRFILLRKGEGGNKYRKERMMAFKEAEQAKGYVFEAVYPNKQYGVVTQLLIMLAQTGITKISAKALAKKATCSERTVMSVVGKLKNDTQILVARLKSARKNNGHYIFVDKTHANFKDIMREVFMVDDVSVAEQNAEQIAEQENAENADTPTVEGAKNASKGFKGFKRHTNNIHNIYIGATDKESVMKEIESEPVKSKAEQEHYVNEYATCTAQKQMLTMIYSIEDMLLPCIRTQAHKIALRIGSTAEWKDVVMARDVLLTITENTNDHVFRDKPTEKTIVATFTERLAYKRTHTVPVKAVKPVLVTPAPFYNWLEEE